MNELECSYLFKDVSLYNTYDRLKKAGLNKKEGK